MRYARLRLGRQLGTEVLPALTRKEQADPASRAQAQLTTLVGDGVLCEAVRIPHAVAPIVVTADLGPALVSTVQSAQDGADPIQRR